MKFGGAIGSDKAGSLRDIDSRYLPKTILIGKDSSFTDVISMVARKGVSYPLIAKPNNGERGKGVEKIANEEELRDYFMSHVGELLIQEFIDSKHELGVLYYKHPHTGEGHITSIVQKGFLKVTGNGKKTLRQLILNNTRSRLRKNYLFHKFSRVLDDVVPKDEVLFLEPVGNHCRGTEFINGQNLINAQLISVFDEISQSIHGFDYGRFDIKVEDIDAMYKGEGIKIMEINGVNAEPAHIYDRSYTLLGAYKVIKKHFDIMYFIAMSRQNESHIEWPTFSEFMTGYREHTRPSA